MCVSTLMAAAHALPLLSSTTSAGHTHQLNQTLAAADQMDLQMGLQSPPTPQLAPGVCKEAWPGGGRVCSLDQSVLQILVTPHDAVNSHLYVGVARSHDSPWRLSKWLWNPSLLNLEKQPPAPGKNMTSLPLYSSLPAPHSGPHIGHQESSHTHWERNHTHLTESSHTHLTESNHTHLAESSHTHLTESSHTHLTESSHTHLTESNHTHLMESTTPT